MSLRRTLLACCIACLVTTVVAVALVTAQKDASQSATNSSTQTVDESAKTRIAERFGRLPLSFEFNAGQSDQAVKFLSSGPGYELFLTATDAVITLQKPHQRDELKRALASGDAQANVREGSVLRLKLIGANASPSVEGQDELPGKVNYFMGSDPEKWRRNVPTYRRVHYKDVYPGIDVVYYGNSQRELEYDLTVAAGANPKLIRFSVAGAEELTLDHAGNLRLKLEHGELALKKPVIYQLNEAGERREVKGSYVIAGNEIRFNVEGFDRKKPLVIDPILSYSTYLGAGSNEYALGIAVDSQGSAYVTGTTDRGIFPTTAGAFKTTAQLGGAFVSKLDPTGSNLVYSTYLAGNFDGSSTGNAIAVDSAGNAHVVGYTNASDFPIVNGLKTNANFFKTTDSAANWNNSNSELPGSLMVTTVAVAPSSPNIIYAGTTAGLYRSNDAGTTWTKTPLTGVSFSPYIFSLAIDPTNASVVYAGFITGGFLKMTDGGNTGNVFTTAPLSFFVITSIAIDPSTPATIYAGSGNGFFKSTNAGSSWSQLNLGTPGTPNVRAVAIDPTVTSTIYAGTFGSGLFKSTNSGESWTPMNNGMGGGSPTAVSAIVIDPANPATIYTGHGSSGGINKSTNGGASWAPVNNGVPGFAVTSMLATSSAVYAATSGGGVIKTTNGGTNWTSANGGLGSLDVQTLAAHPSDPATVYTGTNLSTARDAFVTKLNSSGSALLFSTRLGGSADEFGNSIALDSAGNIYVVGQTNSANFPAVNSIQAPPASPDNCGNGFAAKLNPAGPAYVFSTYLGGNGCDMANAVAVDSAGDAYVTGRTSSTNFPLAGALQATLGEAFNGDAFVTKITSTGSLAYSTYLGGNGTDAGNGIAVDSSGNAYITGITTSSNFPTFNPIQATNGGAAGDAFVTKLNSSGSALVYSTYLGGGNDDIGRGIAVDAAGNAYVTGFTGSVDFPLVTGSLRTKSGIYKSVDGALNWSNDNYGLKTSSISHILVHPIQLSILYAGTEAGVFKSTDGGKNWSAVNNGLSSKRVVGLVMDPTTPQTLYVAVEDFASATNGVYKTTDGGASWTRRSNGLPSFMLLTLAIDPVAPATLYVGNYGGPIYKTTDGANNWAPVGASSPSFVDSIAVDPLNHTTVFAGADFSSGGIFKSVDAGATWQELGFNQSGGGRSVVVSPLTPGLAYAVTSSGGLFKTTDGGSHWSLVLPEAATIVFDPVSSSTIYLLSILRGVQKSTDNGQTWVSMNKGLEFPAAIALAISPVRPSTLHLVSTGSGGTDAFVTKINPAGNALIYSSLLGGLPLPGGQSSASGAAFAIALDATGNAYIAGIAESPNFPVTPESYQPFSRGFADAFIAKLANSYRISGHVLNFGGSPVFGAEVVLNDGTSMTSIITETDGAYEFARLREGGNYTVSASQPQFTVTPPSYAFNNLNADQVANFSTLISDSPFYTLGGQVTENGVGLPGVKVTLSGSQSGVRITDSNGNYSFELIVGGNYTVTPSLLGFSFAPPSQTFNSFSGPQTANFPATRQSFVVTNANDHGAGSLREAITNANATAGADRITFNIPGAGVKVINLLAALPDIIEAVVIDGTTQPGYAGAPLIELDGTMANNASGLVIRAGGTTVRGLAIGNFRSANGIWLASCDNNVIQGNYVGVAATGNDARPNSTGIFITNSSNNTIGGTSAANRNVISASAFSGIEIGGNSNVIQGNFIGTNAAGTAAIPNGIRGVSILNPPWTNNQIGGSSPGAGNLISGNPRGITVNGTGTVIQGNLIGTDVTGTSKIPNDIGVEATGLNIVVGGLTPSARNVISGNSAGVVIAGSGTKLQGNYIGTDVTGTLALGNESTGVVAGDQTVIGGLVPEARNIISANGGLGNVSLGSNNAGSGAIVQGNYIGTDVTGTRSLSNPSQSIVPGISISSNNNLIGGVVAGARNVISGNGFGISVGDSSNAPPGNVIQGNYIGLNAAGTGAVPNSFEGVRIVNGTNTIIGGTQAEAANKIAFNGGPGVFVIAGAGNTIRGNSIFSNGALGIDLGLNGIGGVTPNDATDSDTGPNNLQNFPVITSVLANGGNTTIQGSLKSTANTTFQIDFYSSAALDPSGNGEGALFFGTTPITTDGNGTATINATFPAAMPPGRVITATATDANGNTSEFSAGDATGATGSVQFSVSGMAVLEDVGTANITVLRTGGATGAVSVEYSTSDVTAVAGQDYTATSGTLTFASGETSKTIQVPIVEDATTENDETFTLSLRSLGNPELLGTPNIFTVNIQDSSTPLFLFLTNRSEVVEGDKGTTTQMFFRVNLSAATSRSVSVNYTTSNVTAFGGAACGTPGVDYESANGTLSFPPGVSTVEFPVKICGDTNAEADELFKVDILNGVNATVSISDAFGTIVNDDALILLLEDQGPVPNQAAAIDALLGLRDPFRIVGIPEWLATGPDRNTRILFFAQNLQLNPGEAPSAVTVRFAINNNTFIIPADDVRTILEVPDVLTSRDSDITQVKVRLSTILPVGTYSVTIRAHGRTSNAGTIRIVP